MHCFKLSLHRVPRSKLLAMTVLLLYNFSNPLDQQQRQIKTKHGRRKPWTILHLSKVLCIKEIVFSHITKAFAVLFALRNCFFRKPLIFASIIRLLFFLKKAKHWPVCILGQRVSILEQTPVFYDFPYFEKRRIICYDVALF